MKKLQQLLCLLLCLVLCLALLPAAALAEDADEDAGTITLVEEPAGEGTIAPATEPETLPAPGDEPNAGDVAINAANFPDANFREDVKQYDKNSNGYLSTAELAAVTTMRCYRKNIANLKGVEHFTALEDLYCYSNELTSLDVSKNTALKCLSCPGNQLTSLDVSKNTALTELYCYNNQLTFLDLSAVPALKNAVENGTKNTSNSNYDWYSSSQGSLYVDKTVNIITDATGLGVAINVTNFPDANFREDVKQYDKNSNGYLSPAELAAVTTMRCYRKNIANLKGVEHFTALEDLYCYSNELTSLDVSKNTALKCLSCPGNQLTSLDVSKNTALTELYCYNNQLTFLDLSAVPALKNAVENGTKNTSNSNYDWYSSSQGSLYVDKTVNIITDATGLGVAINVTNFPDANFREDVKQYDKNSNGYLSTAELAAVTTMRCYRKNIANLKGVEHFTALEDLYCYSNELTSLDVSKNTALKCLSCPSNQLTSLDVSKNTALEKLYCYDNQLAFLDLSAVPVLKDAVENGTKNTSNSNYDWYYSSQGDLVVDKTVTIITRGNPFTDVPDDSWYTTPVLWAISQDPPITSGTSDTTFGPNLECTRSQVVTFLYAAAGKPAVSNTNTGFVDVPANAWYATAVAWAKEKGITGGIDATHFGPDVTCTRAQVVTFLYAAAGKPAVSNTNTGFVDVPTGAWYATAVAWAKETGVTGGTDATHFSPNMTCTRAQVVTFLYAAAGKPWG